MKAYLSDIGPGSHHAADFEHDLYGYATHAEYEAHYILDRVQPMRPGYRAADRMLLAEFGWATDEARAAMAESLASFLSAETEI